MKNLIKLSAVACSDIGMIKQSNQDSLLIKHAACSKCEILMAAVCDGMGGLDKGELASATAIRELSEWFEREIFSGLQENNLRIAAKSMVCMLHELNKTLLDYGRAHKIRLGTTFTCVLFINDKYMAVHIGDSRIYRIDASIKQLTTDHTFVAREVARGNMTKDQARVDKRRNLLLKCIGVSETIEPEVLYGRVKKGAYLLCTDGFRHEITEDEIYRELMPRLLINEKIMNEKCLDLIERVKERNEKDNISALLIKAK